MVTDEPAPLNEGRADELVGGEVECGSRSECRLVKGTVAVEPFLDCSGGPPFALLIRSEVDSFSKDTFDVMAGESIGMEVSAPWTSDEVRKAVWMTDDEGVASEIGDNSQNGNFQVVSRSSGPVVKEGGDAGSVKFQI